MTYISYSHFADINVWYSKQREHQTKFLWNLFLIDHNFLLSRNDLETTAWRQRGINQQYTQTSKKVPSNSFYYQNSCGKHTTDIYHSIIFLLNIITTWSQIIFPIKQWLIYSYIFIAAWLFGQQDVPHLSTLQYPEGNDQRCYSSSRLYGTPPWIKSTTRLIRPCLS